MKIFKVEKTIVFRTEESLNLYDGKKKLDLAVSGRVLKVEKILLGFKIKTEYDYEVCEPNSVPIDGEKRLSEVYRNVCMTCIGKIKELEARK